VRRELETQLGPLTRPDCGKGKHISYFEISVAVVRFRGKSNGFRGDRRDFWWWLPKLLVRDEMDPKL
jgi:hypothetical protein